MPQVNPIRSALGAVNSYGNMAKGLTKLGGTGNTLGGLFGKGLGFQGGSLMGDILPGAGAALGIWNMAQNKGNLSNIMSGAGTGASIGSIVPGLGTLVGAGLGAAAGGIEDLFNIGKPDATELQGRDANSALQSALASQATPQQLQEAQQAVASGAWPDTKGPLQIIVARDALIKGGMDPQQADQQAQGMAKNAWNGEKQGGQSVLNAYNTPIQRQQPGATGSSPWSISPMPDLTGAATVQGQSGSTPSLPYTTDAFSAGANKR